MHYSLTGFYVNEAAVNTILQDVLGSDFHIPISIRTEGSPRRRRARAAAACGTAESDQGTGNGVVLSRRPLCFEHSRNPISSLSLARN